MKKRQMTPEQYAKHLAYVKAWQQRNKEKRAASNKAYYDANAVVLRSKQRVKQRVLSGKIGNGVMLEAKRLGNWGQGRKDKRGSVLYTDNISTLEKFSIRSEDHSTFDPVLEEVMIWQLIERFDKGTLPPILAERVARYIDAEFPADELFDHAAA
jgi:uncharacterized protein YeaC (DUF1315 family)